jgi:NAD-dependent oxidoreductase involved in siderophore biosynthesis
VVPGVLRFGLPLLRTAVVTRSDFFDPDAHAAILATLALAADPRSLLLVSSRNPLRIRRCVAHGRSREAARQTMSTRSGHS